MKNLYTARVLAFLGAAFLLGSVAAVAAPFTPGNLVVARVGDGSATLTSAATEVFLDEFTPSGTLVQTIALPTSVSGNSRNRILTASGNNSYELGLTRSADGHYLVLTGYSAAAGTPGVANSQANDITRVIGLVAADGTVDTSTSTGEAFSTSSIRAAATVDGTSFYSVGGNSGVQYQAFGSAVTTQLNTAPSGIRSINVVNNKLYISANSGAYYGLSQVGTGLATTDGQAVTVLPGFPGTTAGSSPNSFYFADLSDAVPGADVVYVADDRSTVGGIQKWSLVAGSWVLNGTIASSAVVRGLSGSTSGPAVALAATSANNLFFLTDDTGYNVTPTLTTLPTAIAVADANTAFRGMAFAPVAAAPTITSFTPTTGGPGTTVTISGTNFTGATAVSIGTLAVPAYTVVSATTITLVLPSSATNVSGLLTVVTPGGTATSTAPFSFTLATVASQALPGLTLFPNPATDYIQVELPQAGAATAALRDLTGRLVQAPVALLPRQRLYLPAGLAAGIYLLEVRQGSAMAVRRLVKQ
ncbi:MAG: IPT/TIG domain-containing protein [Janthinobacterium lividum]